MREITESERTNKPRPVTDAKEVAMEAPERANSPIWPTNITDIICMQYINRLETTIGPASHSCCFTSQQ